MSINENNIKDIDDSTILENTPMVVIEQGGQTLAIPLMGGGGVDQVQADWSQTDDTAVDFIKNKPEIPSKVTDLSDAEQYAKKTDIPTTVASLTDAEQYAKKTDIVQPDWAVADSGSAAYIKNKPEIAPGMALQQVITDTTSTVAAISMVANTRYIFTNPLTSLTISSVEDSNFESEIQFITANQISVTFPSDVQFIGAVTTFYANSTYIVNVKNKIAVIGLIA